MLAAGNFMAMGNLAKNAGLAPGYGADFEAEGVLDDKKLGLEKDDFDEVIQGVVKANS
jgi:hypothetical protein